MRRALIATALPLEYTAVREHLADLVESVHPFGTVYEIGQLARDPHTPLEVALVEVGAGNTIAGLEAARALDFLRPDLALFVGVAGGLKDVTFGDVVAADYVYGYESAKVADVFKPRVKTFNAAYPLVQRARAIARTESWRSRLTSVSDPAPCAYVGPIAAGESVVADKDSETYRVLASFCSDALAVEMEGWGFLFGVHATGDIPALVIRGISDLIEGKSAMDDLERQPAAAEHAAAFACELLASLEGTAEAGLSAPARDTLVTTANGGDGAEAGISSATRSHRFAS